MDIQSLTAWATFVVLVLGTCASLLRAAGRVARAVLHLTSATEANTQAVGKLTTVTSEHGERITTLEEITRQRVNQRAKEIWDDEL